MSLDSFHPLLDNIRRYYQTVVFCVSFLRISRSETQVIKLVERTIYDCVRPLKQPYLCATKLRPLCAYLGVLVGMFTHLRV